MPRWTILLPTRSAPATLGLAIDSGLAQEVRDFELLVVGDGCDAQTRAVVQGYSDSRIRFLDNPKGTGFGYEHRRAALEHARGEYVAFLSDDDVWAPHHLADLEPSLLAGAALAYSLPIWCVPSGHLVPLSADLNDPVVIARFADRNYIPALCWVASRVAIDTAGGWPMDVAEAADWTLWRRILEAPGATVVSHPRPSAVHFRARRREADHPAVAAILDLPELDRWWPASAVISLGAHPHLQAAVVAASSEEWWASLAIGVDAIDRHLAFVATEAWPELVAAGGELRLLRSSRSWQITRPLRALRRGSLRKRGDRTPFEG